MKSLKLKAGFAVAIGIGAASVAVGVCGLLGLPTLYVTALACVAFSIASSGFLAMPDADEE